MKKQSIVGLVGCLVAVLAACSSEVADDGAATGEAVVAQGAAGSPCSRNDDCDRGVYCASDRRCAKVPSLATGAKGCVKLGQDTRLAGGVCKSGACDPATDTCVATAEGLECAKIGGVDCPSGLVCRPTLASGQGSSFHKQFCVKPGQVGDRCGLSASQTENDPDKQCAHGLVCNLEAPVCGNGFCEEDRRIREHNLGFFDHGEVTNRYCAQDCYLPNTNFAPRVFTMGFCAKPASVPEGQPCDSDRVCAQGLICPNPGAPNAGLCTAP
jgi:hypothetical protein